MDLDWWARHDDVTLEDRLEAPWVCGETLPFEAPMRHEGGRTTITEGSGGLAGSLAWLAGGLGAIAAIFGVILGVSVMSEGRWTAESSEACWPMAAAAALAVGSAFLARAAGREGKRLEVSGPARTVRLREVRSGRSREATEVLGEGIAIRVHPVETRNRRGPNWRGEAVRVYVGTQHITVACVKDHRRAEWWVGALRELLPGARVESGLPVVGGGMVRWWGGR